MPDSLAERARAAVDSRPFLRDALRAGVVNYAAAARTLEVDGEEDALATALRRYADELPAYAAEARRASVSMRSGIGQVGDEADATESDAGEPILSVNGTEYGDGGKQTALVASGDVDATSLATVIQRLTADGVTPEAAAVAGDTLLVIVGRREGATAVRAVEDALEHVPVVD